MIGKFDSEAEMLVDSEMSEEDINDLGLTVMREFHTGATRSSEEGKPDYEGFLSPIALLRYGEYMNKHRKQADGAMRDSDNWQRGIPLNSYMKSLLRHIIDFWLIHRGYINCGKVDEHTSGKQELLCAIIFNAFGYLHELEREKCEQIS